MRKLAAAVAALCRIGMRSTCGHHWHLAGHAYWSCCCCGEDHAGTARPVNHAACIRPTWPTEAPPVPVDPVLPVLRDLEEEAGMRAPYENPLTALRWLEAFLGRTPHVFGDPPDPHRKDRP